MSPTEYLAFLGGILVGAVLVSGLALRHCACLG
jgi:hypothetical protein